MPQRRRDSHAAGKIDGETVSLHEQEDLIGSPASLNMPV